jgi:hypothetical protein
LAFVIVTQQVALAVECNKIVDSTKSGIVPQGEELAMPYSVALAWQALYGYLK